MLQAGQVVHTWQDVSFSAFLIACFLPRAFCSLSHCLSQLHCGQVCLAGRQAGRKELVLFSCSSTSSKQSGEGRQSWRGQPRRNASECPRVAGGCRHRSDSGTPPPTLPSEWGLWLKRASGKHYLNPMDCNSFQNACNFMTWGSLHKTALQTPPCFAIRHPRLT